LEGVANDCDAGSIQFLWRCVGHCACGYFDRTCGLQGQHVEKTADTVGKIVVALWAIFPPAFFWIDWVYFCDLSTSDVRDIAKHTHDLARNIWLGVLGVTTLTFFKISP
jgi:hypothetical protein